MSSAANIRGRLARADGALAIAMRTRLHGPSTEAAARGLGRFGEWGAGWAVLGAGAAAVDPARRGRWLRAALAGPAAIWINYGFKLAVRRERPQIEGLEPLGPAASRLSFPSAHATSSGAAAVALSRVEPKAAPALAALAAAVCVGRPFLGMHYPSDVLAGATLGAAIGALWPLQSPQDKAAEVWAS